MIFYNYHYCIVIIMVYRKTTYFLGKNFQGFHGYLSSLKNIYSQNFLQCFGDYPQKFVHENFHFKADF